MAMLSDDLGKFIEKLEVEEGCLDKQYSKNEAELVKLKGCLNKLRLEYNYRERPKPDMEEESNVYKFNQTFSVEEELAKLETQEKQLLKVMQEQIVKKQLISELIDVSSEYVRYL